MITARPRLATALAATALLTAVAVPGAASAETHDGRTVLSVGHADAMQVTYTGGELGLRIKDDTGDSPQYRDPADTLFQVLPEAETAIPAGDQWSFLGEDGDPMWMLPLTQDQDLLWPGWSTEPLAKGQFKNDTVTMSLVDVDGPGDVVLWSVQSLGQPKVSFSTRDGLPDSVGVNVPAHVHSYWAFMAEGSYTLTWKVTGTLADGTTVSTENVRYHWYVGDLPDEKPVDPDPADPGDIDLDGRLVLDQGHVDVMSVQLADGGLNLQAKDGTRLHDSGDVYRDPDDLVFHVTSASEVVLEDWFADPPRDQVGSPGDTRWHLPDTDQQGKLFAGWETASIATGELANDAISLSMVDFSGPGELAMLTVGSFGDADLKIDTKAPLPQTIKTRADTHAHINWYFSEPGVYRLTWQAEAAAVDGTALASDPEDYIFVVGERPGEGTDPDDPDDPADGGEPPAPENTQTITATIDADTGGLILSVDPNDRNVNLPAATLNNTATRWTTSGDLRPVTVTDTRSADPGWNATGQVGDFVSADGEFSGAHLGWIPSVASQGDKQTVNPGQAVNGLLDGGDGLSVSQILAAADAGSGTGTSVLEAELQLDLPTDIESGTYTALVTFTAI